MKADTTHKILNVAIATVWLVNGLFCKVLDFVPRHRQIVAAILGEAYAPVLTRLIGVAEMAMCIWILSGYKTRWNVLTQIAAVATMNLIEYTVAPELLLWGKANMIFAGLFILLLYCHEFVLHKKIRYAD